MARCCGLAENTDKPYLPLERLQSGPGLRERFPFKTRVHLPWERFPNRRPLFAMGVIPFARAPSPRRAHNEGADPKNRAGKFEHYFAARLLVSPPFFRRVSFLVGVLPLGPRLCEPITFGRYSFTKLDCGMLRQPCCAVLSTLFSVKQFLVLLATMDGRSH